MLKGNPFHRKNSLKPCLAIFEKSGQSRMVFIMYSLLLR